MLGVAPAASGGGHLMNIEKLIERLRTESLYKDKATLEIMDLCIEAADALSTLQAENEKLWTGLKSNVDLVFRQAKELDRRHLLLQEQEAELEQVKQKYGEAREAICTHCMDVPCQGESCYWWQGPEEG